MSAELYSASACRTPAIVIRLRGVTKVHWQIQHHMVLSAPHPRFDKPAGRRTYYTTQSLSFPLAPASQLPWMHQMEIASHASRPQNPGFVRNKTPSTTRRLRLPRRLPDLHDQRPHQHCCAQLCTHPRPSPNACLVLAQLRPAAIWKSQATLRNLPAHARCLHATCAATGNNCQRALLPPSTPHAPQRPARSLH
jgi:hypothetical protein